MIESGTVEIYKDNITLTHLITGQHFGVMALLDEGTRSANVKAATQTQLKSINLKALKTLLHHAEDSIFFKILQNHLHNQQEILRSMNVANIHETKQKLAEAKKNLSFSSFAAYRYTLNSGYSSSFFGISTAKWKAHLQESLIWTIPFLILVTLIKWFQVQYIAAYQGENIIDINRIFQHDLKWVLLFFGLYILDVPSKNLSQEESFKLIYKTYLGIGNNTVIKIDFDETEFINLILK